MEFKTTFTATECGTITVPFVDMPTVRALLRGVPGIYNESMLSNSLSLVSDKLLKLIKRPTIELAVKLFTSTLLNSDLAQIFESKYSIFRIHNLLRYAVIDISRKPSFPTGQTLELAFGRFGAFGLQLLAKIGITSTPIFDLLGVEESVVRADCNIHYTAIYSKDFKVSNLFRIVMFKGYMQIENLVSAIIRDCRGLNSPIKIISAMRWYKESSLDPTFCGSDGGDTMLKVHSDYSLIVSHCGEGLTFWKRFTFNSLQSFASTVSSSLNQRRREALDTLTGKLVGCIVVIHLIPRLVLESPFCGDGERFSVISHRVEKSPTILVGQPKLECYRPKHIHIVGD